VLLAARNADGGIHRPRRPATHQAQLTDFYFQSPMSRWHWAMREFDQRLDHLNSFSGGMFKQRYMLNTTFWGGVEKQAPMFFFTGAEGGDITRVVGAYGHVIEMAERMQGLVVMMESRFFGSSLPFGRQDSYRAPVDRVGLLTVEQVLLDYVEIIIAVHAEFDPEWRCPSIAFGGSLAGTQAAMIRFKYPTVVDMSLASSAPLHGFPTPGFDAAAWRKRVTDTWVELATGQHGCPVFGLVQRAFASFENADPDAVKQALNTCETPYPGNNWDARDEFWAHIESYGTYGYPWSTSAIPKLCELAFYTSKLPTAGGLDIAAAFLPETTGCLNLTASRERENFPDSKGWDLLACTEIVHPIGATNVTDFFPPSRWSVEATAEECRGRWNATPRDAGLWIPRMFGFGALKASPSSDLSNWASHVIFSYGELDP